MNRNFFLPILILITFILTSCSKKSHPSQNPVVTPIIGLSSDETKKNDSLTLAKPVIKRAPKALFPKVITVNDSVAHKSVDGRYYYDVMGHRYGRNNKDGKYYLFNKSMYNNDEFKKPG
ncbi:MAG: hypothetical protein M3Z26_05475 [Bacteroidota bacterium]|nr:hypothetical protein [Bacteroidota bacterium]